MKLSGSALASSRRVVVALGFAAVMGAASVAFAQAPAAAAPAQAAAPADPFKFTTDAAGIIWMIKSDKAADFEAVWKAIKAKLVASDNPEYKALGDSLKMYKADIPAGPDGDTYLFVADPASKTTSYGVSPFLLYESKLFTRAEADEMFAKLSAAISRINPLPMNAVK